MSFTLERSIVDIVTDFLGSAPTLEQIITYQLPDDLQQRAHALLEKRRLGELTADEGIEMENFREIDHLLTLIKAKARVQLKAQHE